MDICIVTGQTDNILSGTTDMLRILNEKGIHNRGSVWDAPYGHDWPWWKTADSDLRPVKKLLGVRSEIFGI